MKAKLTIRDISSALHKTAARLDAGDPVDVRLQVYDDGSWALRVGSSDYDQDHRGFWGASCLGARESLRRCRDLARDLIEQVRDHAALVA